jgi:uncharacterized protein
MTDRSILNQVRALDVMAFSRQGASLQGDWPLASMPRLAAAVVVIDEAAASWQLQGEQRAVAGAEPEVWLHLQADIEVQLQCQRCLQSMSERLDVDRSFRFVRNEAEAVRLDEESEDDVMALVPRLDVMDLLEDEFILGLPIVPRHEVCPSPLQVAVDTAGEDEAPPHPFAALAALKNRKPSGD